MTGRVCGAYNQVQHELISCSACIDACEKEGRWQEALSLFQRIPQRKLRHTSMSFSALVSTCEKGGQALQVLNLRRRRLS